MKKTYQLNVNGKSVKVEAEGEQSLLNTLRDDLDLTGAKYGCGEAQCGACTVLLDGAPTRSCVTSLASVGAKEIFTIEGLERNGKLHPVQEAFLEVDALQCAYCTSGMILSSVALLKKAPNPSESDTLQALNGHICRCGCYPRILTAVGLAAKKMRQVNP